MDFISQHIASSYPRTSIEKFPPHWNSHIPSLVSGIVIWATQTAVFVFYFLTNKQSFREVFQRFSLKKRSLDNRSRLELSPVMWFLNRVVHQEHPGSLLKYTAGALALISEISRGAEDVCFWKTVLWWFWYPQAVLHLSTHSFIHSWYIPWRPVVYPSTLLSTEALVMKGTVSSH